MSDFLGIIGANTARLQFENIRIEHEVYSNINREVNCDSGNTGRQAEAAARRGELIGRLLESPEAEKLPKSLYEAAVVHQQNPGASIAELGSHDESPHREVRYEPQTYKIGRNSGKYVILFHLWI